MYQPKHVPAERFEVVNGLRHHVLTWNETGATTVVLCHGFLDLAWSFAPLADRLVEHGHRVVAFDWRGHGETEWVGPGGYYHFADYVLDLERMLPRIANGPIHLVGHSMGGTACAMFAGTRPSNLATLSLVEGLGPPEQKIADAPKRFRAWFDTVDRVRQAPRRVMPTVQAALGRMRRQNPSLDDSFGIFLASKGTVLSDLGEGVHWCFDPLHQTRAPLPFRREVLRAFAERVDVPALLVAGERGFRLPDETERASSFRGHTFVEIPGVGHMVHWFAPDALAEALQNHWSA